MAQYRNKPQSGIWHLHSISVKPEHFIKVWSKGEARLRCMLLLVGVEFNLVLTEGLIQIPKIGLCVRLVSDAQAIVEALY